MTVAAIALDLVQRARLRKCWLCLVLWLGCAAFDVAIAAYLLF